MRDSVLEAVVLYGALGPALQVKLSIPNSKGELRLIKTSQLEWGLSLTPTLLPAFVSLSLSWAALLGLSGRAFL